METFGIAELAARAEVTPRTIRYYIAEGLLPGPGGAGKRHAYTVDHLRYLRAIRRFKEAYLPLTEIRKRLAALSAAELEAFSASPDVSHGVRPADDPGARLPARSRPDVLSRPAPTPEARPFWAAPSAHLSFVAPGAVVPRGPVANPDPSVWHRVTLAAGVELHYQVSGDRARDLALDRFIQSAIGVLANLPPPDDSHPSA